MANLVTPRGYSLDVNTGLRITTDPRVSLT